MTLVRGDQSISVAPFTYCWTPASSDDGTCADGEPPADPPALGGEGPISLYFPADDFVFEARVFDSEYERARAGPVITRVDGRWEFELAPAPGTAAIIELFGLSDTNDVIVSFRIDG